MVTRSWPRWASAWARRADIDRWNPVVTVTTPDPRRAEIYQGLYAHYRELYPATRDVSHALAARQHTDAMLTGRQEA